MQLPPPAPPAPPQAAGPVLAADRPLQAVKPPPSGTSAALPRTQAAAPEPEPPPAQTAAKPAASPDPPADRDPMPAAAAPLLPGPAPAAPTAPAAPAAHPKPAAQPSPPSPAAQIAPALVSVAHAPNGSSRLTLRLDPPELGRVEVRVLRPAGEPVRVEVTVQRPETLGLLLRDQPQLQRALDQAGLPADGRSLTFHVVAPPAAPAPWASAGDGSPGFAGNGSSGFVGTGDGHASNRHGGDAPSGPAAEQPAGDAGPAALPVWLRAGLDITA
jgi:hypothetical protein